MSGKVTVIDYVENEDGSAKVVFECDETAKQLLISEGLSAVIQRTLETHEKET